MEKCLLCTTTLGPPKAQMRSIQSVIDPITHPWIDDTDRDLVRLDGISRYLGVCLRCLAELPYINYGGRDESLGSNMLSMGSSSGQIVHFEPIAALEYLELGKEIITRVKFSKETRLRNLWMILGLLALENSLVSFPKIHELGVVVPVPGSGFGHWQRGFQPVTWLAKDLSKLLGVPMMDLLIHQGNQSQKLLTRHQRLANQSPIKLRNRPGTKQRGNVEQRLKGKEILLVDDVITTGSTLRNVSNLLEDFQPGSIRMITLVKD